MILGQMAIVDSLDTQNGNDKSSNKHLWIKKATGLGISEFMFRFMTWLCLKDNSLSGSQMCIVTGPRIDLAIALIDTMKRLFAGKGLMTFDTKETVIELNNVKIEAFPSHHLDAMRGLPNVSFILLDEADFFPNCILAEGYSEENEKKMMQLLDQADDLLAHEQDVPAYLRAILSRNRTIVSAPQGLKTS
jgi:late competence protein required for DNA uptake (superfamily II DNA/RNA helicase)